MSTVHNARISTIELANVIAPLKIFLIVFMSAPFFNVKFDFHALLFGVEIQKNLQDFRACWCFHGSLLSKIALMRLFN
jgi:hypothetical protein